MKIDAHENKLLESIDRGAWKSDAGTRERMRAARCTKASARS